MLPQVLVGLGVVSTLSSGCLLWLQRLQPFFFIAAVALLGYQVWLVLRRRANLRTATMKAILGISVGLNAVIIGGWIVLSIRYR